MAWTCGQAVLQRKGEVAREMSSEAFARQVQKREPPGQSSRSKARGCEKGAALPGDVCGRLTTAGVAGKDEPRGSREGHRLKADSIRKAVGSYGRISSKAMRAMS